MERKAPADDTVRPQGAAGDLSEIQMQTKSHERIAGELNLEHWQVAATEELLSRGATIPFIARYRKEATGALDETVIAGIRDRLTRLEELEKRRDTVLRSIEKQGKLSRGLRKEIEEAQSLTVLEDLYLPFRPKRRTRGTVAKEKGLEPLARTVFAQNGGAPEIEADPFVSVQKGVETVEQALAGARDIVAEWINEDQKARGTLRSLFRRKSVFRTRVVPEKEQEGAKFRDYFEWEEPTRSAPSHRILAMRRGERDGVLRLKVCLPDEEDAIRLLEGLFVMGEEGASRQVKLAVQEGFKRLLSQAMETGIRLESKNRAEEEAFQVFGRNLRQLLLAPPLGQKRIFAIDPGFRTGAKVVCLDSQGKLLHTETVYPLLSSGKRSEAGERIRHLCREFRIEAIAVGNGTGGRETEGFLREAALDPNIPIVVVNESGASVYSASETAREEFPDYDVTVRGAVSIGRRLMDPLAELVKIDPKSIGVGQYQHDVDQKGLKRRLEEVVVSCVNAVGVEANTASKELLARVSGLSPQVAGNMVSYREMHGPFPDRETLKKVPMLGPKAFEQAAGFLRIRGGRHPLDASAVHPERYRVVEDMARDLNCSVEDLLEREDLRRKIRLEAYVSEDTGLFSLQDILEELAKPGRDPRKEWEVFQFAEGVEKLEDLEKGMRLPGIVTNITAFGVFVDVGVHQDGLVHISQLADRFVKDPNHVVKMHQHVWVTVLDVDKERKRISLSMKENAKNASSPRGKRSQKSEKAPFNNPFAKIPRGK